MQWIFKIHMQQWPNERSEDQIQVRVLAFTAPATNSEIGRPLRSLSKSCFTAINDIILIHRTFQFFFFIVHSHFFLNLLAFTSLVFTSQYLTPSHLCPTLISGEICVHGRFPCRSLRDRGFPAVLTHDGQCLCSGTVGGRMFSELFSVLLFVLLLDSSVCGVSIVRHISWSVISRVSRRAKFVNAIQSLAIKSYLITSGLPIIVSFGVWFKGGFLLG
jgi:hypothetical protein